MPHATIPAIICLFVLGFAGGWIVILPIVGAALGHRAGIGAALLFAAWLAWAAATGHLPGSGLQDPEPCYDRQGTYIC